MLGAHLEQLPVSASRGLQQSGNGACNEFMIHYEGTTDVAQPVPASPVMDSGPSATLESFSVDHIISVPVSGLSMQLEASLVPHNPLDYLRFIPCPRLFCEKYLHVQG